jgi:hypothetical protein
MKLFNSLPVATQNEIKSTLSAYDRCSVERDQNGVYKVTTAIVLHCGTYNEIIGDFTKDEIFTPEEQIVNYMNTFREFPYPAYKGAKDWKALATNWKIATLENGNFVFK